MQLNLFEEVDDLLSHSQGLYNIRGKEAHKINGYFVHILEADMLQCMAENDVFWQMFKRSDFIEAHISKGHALKVHVTKRYYGQSKLVKPVELKGVKQAFSVDYIPGKARCQVFINGNDIWIKHVDWFSPSLKLPDEDVGAPLGYLTKKYGLNRKVKGFIYDDAWGDIVLRNEAWVHIENILYRLKIGEQPYALTALILRQIERLESFKAYDLIDTNMERFFENVIKRCTEEVSAH